jgi:hypothetical protein
MEAWTEAWRGIVAPWECDITEHFTIAYYFDRLADATAMTGGILGLDRAPAAASTFGLRVNCEPAPAFMFSAHRSHSTKPRFGSATSSSIRRTEK